MIYLVTGGAGFIGSNFLLTFVPRHPEHLFINVDALTYAGNLSNLQQIEELPNYRFEHVDITDYAALERVFEKYKPDVVVHFAAESHVDRSISSPKPFIETNILGTLHLLELARLQWQGRQDVLFHHISTDEVYGSLGAEGFFSETTPYQPTSPYSASKAGSDHLVRAYYHTYGLPVTITNCSNNYGPYHFPEKLIHLMIHNILEEKPLPIYGKGDNIRDWLYVEDHSEAIWIVMEKGKRGSSYNIGGHNERTNLQVVETLCDTVAEITGKSKESCRGLIRFVEDRPGHDRRYAIDPTKIQEELGWVPSVDFETGIRKTVEWYLAHQDWVKNITSGRYKQWIEQNYAARSTIS